MSTSTSLTILASIIGFAIIFAQVASILFSNYMFNKLNKVKHNGRITTQAKFISDSELKRKRENSFKRSFFTR